MDPKWNDHQPIYRQLRDRMAALLLEGALKEGDALPSVRSVAADYRLNPLTVLKGYQQLVDEQLVEKRRGRGMYVSEGARRRLLAGERDRFLRNDWPQILAVIRRLGFSAQELLEPRAVREHAAPRRRVAALLGFALGTCKIAARHAYVPRSVECTRPRLT
jgi:GntR family transcriptional regulator